MNPTLDDCNEVLDWLEDNFDCGKNLRARVVLTDGGYSIILTWFGASHPSSLGIYTPSGWAMSNWWIDENQNWQVNLFEV